MKITRLPQNPELANETVDPLSNLPKNNRIIRHYPEPDSPIGRQAPPVEKPDSVFVDIQNASSDKSKYKNFSDNIKKEIEQKKSKFGKFSIVYNLPKKKNQKIYTIYYSEVEISLFKKDIRLTSDGEKDLNAIVNDLLSNIKLELSKSNK